MDKLSCDPCARLSSDVAVACDGARPRGRLLLPIRRENQSDPNCAGRRFAPRDSGRGQAGQLPYLRSRLGAGVRPPAEQESGRAARRRQWYWTQRCAIAARLRPMASRTSATWLFLVAMALAQAVLHRCNSTAWSAARTGWFLARPADTPCAAERWRDRRRADRRADPSRAGSPAEDRELHPLGRHSPGSASATTLIGGSSRASRSRGSVARSRSERNRVVGRTTLQAAGRIGMIEVLLPSRRPVAERGSRRARGSDPQGGCPDRGAGLHPQVPRPVHRHQARRLGDGGPRGAAGPAGRRRLHADGRACGRCVVHGGGKAITLAMEQAGLEPRFVQGRRYTDDATLEIVARVLAEEINADIVRHINKFGGRAVGPAPQDDASASSAGG